jgi:hypothetical protein
MLLNVGLFPLTCSGISKRDRVMASRIRVMFVLVGFEEEPDRICQNLTAKLAGGGNENLKIIGQKWRGGNPTRYLESVGRIVRKEIFGSDELSNLCKADGRCRDETIAHSARLCGRSKHQTLACRKAAPDFIAIISSKNFYDACSEFFGLSLFLRKIDRSYFVESETLSQIYNILSFDRDFVYFMRNIPRNNMSPLLPVLNYYSEMMPEISCEIFNETTDISEYFKTIHLEFYDGAFKNPVKPEIRGAYMFTDNIFFQRDRLHDNAFFAPGRSRDNELIWAHYRLGVSFVPGFHFDVMQASGKKIGRTFMDKPTQARSDPESTHLNVTPCDRIL